jgi:hypothetical protein
MDRHIQLPAALILDGEKFARVTVQLTLDQTAKTTNTMIDMNNIITDLQICIDRLGCLGNGSLASARLRALPTEDLRIRDQMKDWLAL